MRVEEKNMRWGRGREKETRWVKRRRGDEVGGEEGRLGRGALIGGIE